MPTIAKHIVERILGCCVKNRQRGFTLLELMMVVAIIGVLAAFGIALYTDYVARGQLAQTLTDYGHIRTVVGVEAYAEQRTGLEANSAPGKVPPALAHALSDQQFNEIDGIKLQMVKAPAGTFISNPTQDVYALIASADTDAGIYRLQLLRRVLPQTGGDKLWLSANELYFPLDIIATDATQATTAPNITPPTPLAPPPATPSTPVAQAADEKQTHWNTPTAVVTADNTWTGSANLCVMGTDQQPLTGINAQAQFRVTEIVQTWDGQSTERSWITQIPFNGGCGAISESGLPLPASGKEGVTALQFEMLDVFYYWPTDPATKWDGVKPTLTLSMPLS